MAEQTSIEIISPFEGNRKTLLFDGPTVPTLSAVLCKLGFMILMDPETLLILHDMTTPVPNSVLFGFEWSLTTIKLHKNIFVTQRDIVYPAMDAKVRNEADRVALAALKETFEKMLE